MLNSKILKKNKPAFCFNINRVKIQNKKKSVCFYPSGSSCQLNCVEKVCSERVWEREGERERLQWRNETLNERTWGGDGDGVFWDCSFRFACNKLRRLNFVLSPPRSNKKTTKHSTRPSTAVDAFTCVSIVLCNLHCFNKTFPKLMANSVVTDCELWHSNPKANFPVNR